MFVNVTFATKGPNDKYSQYAAAGVYPHALITIDNSQDDFQLTVSVPPFGALPNAYCFQNSSGNVLLQAGVAEFMGSGLMQDMRIRRSFLHGHGVLKHAKFEKISYPSSLNHLGLYDEDDVKLVHKYQRTGNAPGNGNGNGNGGSPVSTTSLYDLPGDGVLLKNTDRLEFTFEEDGTDRLHMSPYTVGGDETLNEMALWFGQFASDYPIASVRFAAPKSVCNGAETTALGRTCQEPNEWADNEFNAHPDCEWYGEQGVCLRTTSSGCVLIPDSP